MRRPWFVLLMPNSTKQSAIDFMDALREKIPTLNFPNIESKAHISIGICYADPDSILTDSEIKHHANMAKKYAKAKAGKDCIVTFRGESYTEDQLIIVKPDV